MFEHTTESTWSPDWLFILVGIMAIFALAYFVSLLIELVEERMWKSFAVVSIAGFGCLGLLGYVYRSVGNM